jgi:hypothetical protein
VGALGRALLTVALLAPLATACSQADLDMPPRPAWQTAGGDCSWQWQTGSGVGLWTERCHLSSGLWRLDWDKAANAFFTYLDTDSQGLAVQIWWLDQTPPLVALQAALVEAGQLAADAPCAWEAVVEPSLHASLSVYRLAPTVADALAPTPTGEVPEPVCGGYGVSTHGLRYFLLDPRRPDRAIFVEMGQERPLFDVSSLRFLD